MLIESWSVNSAKHDIAEERYEQLDGILRGMNVSKEFYDPVAMASSGDPDFAIDSADGLQLDDDFDGGTFNSEDIDGAEGVADTTVTAPPQDYEAGEEPGAPAPADKESTQQSIDQICSEMLDTPHFADKFRTDPQVTRLLGRAQQLVDDGQYEEGRDMGNTLTALLEEGRFDS